MIMDFITLRTFISLLMANGKCVKWNGTCKCIRITYKKHFFPNKYENETNWMAYEARWYILTYAHPKKNGTQKVWVFRYRMVIVKVDCRYPALGWFPSNIWCWDLWLHCFSVKSHLDHPKTRWHQVTAVKGITFIHEVITNIRTHFVSRLRSSNTHVLNT